MIFDKRKIKSTFFNAVRIARFTIAFIAASAGFSVYAQNSSSDSDHVVRKIDANGVDLMTGKLSLEIGSVAVGPVENKLGISLIANEEGIRTTASSGIQYNYVNSNVTGDTSLVKRGYRYTLSHGDGQAMFFQCNYYQRQTFIYSCEDGTQVQTLPDLAKAVDELGIGASISSIGQGIYNVQLHDGSSVSLRTLTSMTSVRASFESVHDGRIFARTSSIRSPLGIKSQYNYRDQQYNHCSIIAGMPSCSPVYTLYRVQSVSNNLGYLVKLEYVGDTLPQYDNDPNFSSAREAYGQIAKITAINMAQDYCDTTADHCPTLSMVWPSLSIAKSTQSGGFDYTVTDTLNRTTTLRYRSVQGLGVRLTAVQRPSSAVDNISISYDTAGRVSSMTVDGVMTNYAYSVSGNFNIDPLNVTLTTTATAPLGSMEKVISWMDPSFATSGSGKVTGPRDRVLATIDGMNRSTSYAYDQFGRTTQTIFPEGNKTLFQYDNRGNVLEVRSVAKSGSGLADVVTSATFDASCQNVIKCNKPNSVTDARQFTTDYTYDPNHGGVLEALGPVVNGIRPRMTTSYVAAQAYYKNSSGTIVASGENIILPSVTSVCKSLANCTGTADEIKVVAGYGPQAPGTPNNLMPVSIAAVAGDNSLSAVTTRTFDAMGNVVSVDGPLAGSADTSAYIYDSERQRIGEIGPDPDAGGTAKNSASRYVYNAAGQIAKVERGTTSGQGTAAWQAFNSLEQVVTTFKDGKPSTVAQQAGGATYTLTQYSYDARGRLECTAVRMQTAAFGSIPGSACVLGTEGINGPDRVERLYYNSADQLVQRRSAVGTPDEAEELTVASFTPSGKPQAVRDANGNATSYAYDGFDRLKEVHFPNSTGDGASSATDYLAFNYDPSGNIVQRRLRDGQIINFSFDALNRIVFRDVGFSSQNIAYGYDATGHMLFARFGSAAGEGATYEYDALGRLVRSTNNLDGVTRALTYAYDISGARTNMTWPDGFGVDYSYFDNGALKAIKTSGASPQTLATYAYDNQGRVKTVIRGASAGVTEYTWDPISRLKNLAHDLPETVTPGQDVDFDLTYNPASQIKEINISNDGYLETLPALNKNYSVNSLNQYTSDGPTGFEYDDRGNLRAQIDGSAIKTFTYDIENRLTGASGASPVSIRYDSLGRLFETARGSGGPKAQFLYDGDDVVAEYDASGALTHRYIYGGVETGPIIDWVNPLLPSKVRVNLFSDWQGSIVAKQSLSGISLNTYDENGVGGALNGGRFQYAGQMFIPELGLYHFGTRAYAPGIGRFLQPDTLGYADGMNLYAYAGNDPINNVDPQGTQSVPIIVNGNRPLPTPPPPRIPGVNGAPVVTVNPACYSNPSLCVNRPWLGGGQVNANPYSPECQGQVRIGCGIETGGDSGQGEFQDIGYYKGIQTFGDKPESARRDVVGTNRPGGVTGYQRDLTYLARLNGIPNPIIMAYPDDFKLGLWQMFGKPTNGGVVYIGPGPAYGFSGRLGADGDWRITIPRGFLIAPNTPAGIGEVVHYRSGF